MKKTVEQTHKRVIVPFIDLILGRTVSKKLTVFIIATVAFFKDMLTGPEWMIISGIYMFGLLYLNHLQEMARLKENKKNEEDNINY